MLKNLKIDKSIFSKNQLTGHLRDRTRFEKYTILTSAKSQKARGVFFLYNRRSAILNTFDMYVPKHIIFPAGKEFGKNSFNYPVFARPCPNTPRHGFVDSTVCKTHEELNEISKETLNEESNSELLVTKPVDSFYNIIINGERITFALGNDGATSGNNCCHFYLPEDKLSEALKLDDDIIQDGEIPFYEIVIGKDCKTYLVQVRSAPGVPRTKNFLPQKVEVQSIIKAEGSLLEWERKLSQVDPSTTVIDHAGGSLSSHYSIHAITNNIAVFTTDVPAVGEIIEPQEEVMEITEQEREMFREAFFSGFTCVGSLPQKLKLIHFNSNNKHYILLKKILSLALSTLHSYNSIFMHRDFQNLGLVLGMFVRATFCVSAGEARYSPGHTKNCQFNNSTYLTDEQRESVRDSISELPSDRGICYAFVAEKNLDKCLKDIENFYLAFRCLKWSSDYGGKKWKKCTKSSIDLYNACVSGKIEKVVQLFNKVINQEHNGGKYLNKINSSSNVYDKASHDVSMFTLGNLKENIDILYSANQYHIAHNNISYEEYYSPINLGKYKSKCETFNAPYGIYISSEKNLVPALTHICVLLQEADNILFELNKPLPLDDLEPVILDGKTLFKLEEIPRWWVHPGSKELIISKIKIGKLIRKQMLEASKKADNASELFSASIWETEDNGDMPF